MKIEKYTLRAYLLIGEYVSRIGDAKWMNIFEEKYKKEKLNFINTRRNALIFGYNFFLHHFHFA